MLKVKGYCNCLQGQDEGMDDMTTSEHMPPRKRSLCRGPTEAYLSVENGEVGAMLEEGQNTVKLAGPTGEHERRKALLVLCGVHRDARSRAVRVSVPQKGSRLGEAAGGCRSISAHRPSLLSHKLRWHH